MLSRETNIELGLRLIPLRKESRGARVLNTQYDAQAPVPDDRSRICTWMLKMMGTAITAPASHVPPFTSVRKAAQALPFSELCWERFEKLTGMDLEKACTEFFAGGWLARNDMFYIAFAMSTGLRRVAGVSAWA